MNELVDRLLTRAPNGNRFMLGIIGYPGSGKSTLAQRLVENINRRFERQPPAVLLPMDGFHLQNDELERRQLLSWKGIPETFDGQGFVALVKKLRQHPDKQASAPLFDRSKEASIPGAISIEPAHQLLIIEGNYLLYEKPPWNEIAGILDETWFLDCELETIKERLLQRHIQCGRSPQQAEAKMRSTDLPNADLIERTRKRAAFIVSADCTGYRFAEAMRESP